MLNDNFSQDTQLVGLCSSVVTSVPKPVWDFWSSVCILFTRILKKNSKALLFLASCWSGWLSALSQRSCFVDWHENQHGEVIGANPNSHVVKGVLGVNRKGRNPAGESKGWADLMSDVNHEPLLSKYLI